jgi:hypothetical protein
MAGFCTLGSLKEGYCQIILSISMIGFKLISETHAEIRFRFYEEFAPVTSNAFSTIIPFTSVFHHAIVSGHEFWINNVPRLDIIQENASVFIEPGEVVFGPSRPVRNKTSNCFGIYYGDGKGLDACNIFGKVIDEDMDLLASLGNHIWSFGPAELSIVPYAD